MPADDLATFLVELRRRLDAGELANLPPIELNRWTMMDNVERGVRVLLAEAASFAAMPPEQRAIQHFAARRRKLARDFEAIRRALEGG